MSWFTTVEADVVKFIQKVEMDVQVADKEAKAALNWVASQSPTIAANVAAVAQFISMVPFVGTNPAVLASVSAANLAVQGLNQLALAYTKAQTGNLTSEDLKKAVASGYATYKGAAAAVHQAMATAVSNTKVASK